MKKQLTEEQKIEMQEKKAEKAAKKVFELCFFEIWYNSLSWTIREKGAGGRIFYFSSFLGCLEEIADTISNRKMAKVKNLEEAIAFLKERDVLFLKELKEAIKGKVLKSEHYHDFKD